MEYRSWKKTRRWHHTQCCGILTILFLVLLVLLWVGRLANSSAQSYRVVLENQEILSSLVSQQMYENCLPVEGDHVFDWIVVGAGSGGCAATERLSSNPLNRVLLVDIGSNRSADPDVQTGPGSVRIQSFQRPELFLRYPCVQPDGVTARFDYLTGNVLGGASRINGQQYVRPSDATLDEWSQINGGTQLWNAATINAEYVEFEKYNGPTSNPLARGTDGLNDIRLISPSGSSSKFAQAVSNALGYPTVVDYNDPNTPHGPFTRWQLLQQPNRMRESSDTAFLNSDTMARQNLRVLSKTRVTRIVWQQGNSANRADGILFTAADGSCRHARARKGVVVSAGIGSPLLLQFSGIGNATTNERVGIQTVVDLPSVGKQLKNHYGFSAVFLRNSSDALAPTAEDMYSGGAFLRNPGQVPDASKPRDWQYLTVDANPNILVVVPIQLRPAGSGSVEIDSNDPFSVPIVTESPFGDATDVQAFVDVIQQQLVPIANALNAIDPSYVMISPPSSILSDPAALITFVKQNLVQAYHYQNTCRMAPRAEGGVVDVHAKVYDTENVYVADVSIMPVSNDGNTDAPARIIGYVVGDRLKSL